MSMYLLSYRYTSVQAIWNARDHIKFVQNLLGGVLDQVESFKNIFNWTLPSKVCCAIDAVVYLIFVKHK
jgi:hypothetical protein